VGDEAFAHCWGLTSLTLGKALTSVGRNAFSYCSALAFVGFRPSRAFIVWAVGAMRNRANWQLTTMKHLRNVLAIITAYAVGARDVGTVDPGVRNRVLKLLRDQGIK